VTVSQNPQLTVSYSQAHSFRNVHIQVMLVQIYLAMNTVKFIPENKNLWIQE
jgi:hypothetical protein